MPVETPHVEYIRSASKWNVIRTLFEGREAVINAGSEYTPSLPGADREDNEAYLQRGSLFNALARTLEGLTGAVFQKAPTIEFPASQKKWLKDITLTGVPMESFSLDALQDVMLVGRGGILIEMPYEESTATRPYLCSWEAESIINWRTTRIAGDEVVTRVVLYETVTEPNTEDVFVDSLIEQYRVLELELDIDTNSRVYTQQVWRKPTDEKEFVAFGPKLIPTRRKEPLAFIPFVFLGPMHLTPRVAKPPLLDLAYLNLGHWRNSCDLEHGLHLVALPTPWVAGMSGASSTDDEDESIGIGPSRVWELDVQGSAGMLEFKGAGLASIVTAMSEKKSEMAIAGSRVLESQPSTAETALAVGMRHAGEHATLRTITQTAEQALTRSLQIMVWWAGTELLPSEVKGVSIGLNKNFLNIKASPEEIKTALLALMDDKISFETWWGILTAGSWVNDEVTAQEEKSKIDSDAPKEPELYDGVGSEDDDNPEDENLDAEDDSNPDDEDNAY